MKTKINCYKTNADLFVNNNTYNINWDGLTFIDNEDWNDWATETLKPCEQTENYEDIKNTLYIHTNHLIKE